ncbi:MAG: LEA type 2 family protein [Bacteroidetes bacterium]|nr:LEA type 2 family protein [Bacteroidota bacterium]
MRKWFGLLSVIILASCANPKSLEYHDVKNFQVGNISLTPEIGMDVEFYNPNNYPMTLKDANIDLYIENKLVGHVTMENKYTVPAADTFLLPVKLHADLKGIISNALQVMANKEMNIKLQGSVKAGRGILVPIRINYEGKKKLNVF